MDPATPDSKQGTLVSVLLEPAVAAIIAAWRATDWAGEVALRFVPGGAITHVHERRDPMAVSSATVERWGEIAFGKVEVTWQNFKPHIVSQTRTTKLEDGGLWPM